jgi:UPF0755 protein
MYKLETGRKKKSKLFIGVLVSLAVLMFTAIAGVLTVRYFYLENLKPRSTINETISITITPGSTTTEIATLLEERGIIRAKWAFEWYARLSGANNQFKAGTYNLSPALPVRDIVSIITEGKVATDTLTVLPGSTIDDIKKVFKASGYSDEEISDAFQRDNFRDHPVVASIPEGLDLEGYLYPDSYQRTADTTAESMVRAALDRMETALTPDVVNAFTAQGLSVHQGITLASIVEKESAHPEDRAKIAQVFLKRLSIGMRLESDPTATYGARKAGLVESITTDTPYNTYTIDGLPPSPISTVTIDAIEAVINPAQTEYLFFVASDPDENGDNTTYFSFTLEEHQRLTEQYCKVLCGR